MCPPGSAFDRVWQSGLSFRSWPGRPGHRPGRSFCFYYEDSLQVLQQAGADLVFFSPLHDGELPPCDGLYLGGGYPELYAQALSQNASMRASLRRALDARLPCIAECGGFMYLHQAFRDSQDRLWPWVGAVPGETFMTSSLKRFGYVTLKAEKDNLLCCAGDTVTAHEFHYSDSTDNGHDFTAYKAGSQRHWPCIMANDHFIGGYPHIHFLGKRDWAARFVAAVSIERKELMKIEHILPADIERRSMEIIEDELGDIILPPDEKDIIKRVVHTSADFDYVRNLRFSPDAVDQALTALKGGCTIVTDTNMACMGISQPGLKKLGCRKVCFMADEDVAAAAKAQGTTRAQASMDKAAALEGPVIVAVGNAPTALLRLRELIDAGKMRPALIIGVPVGFVNVVYAKEVIMEAGVPYIVAKGRKGGSTIAAAICNALIYRLTRG